MCNLTPPEVIEIQVGGAPPPPPSLSRTSSAIEVVSASVAASEAAAAAERGGGGSDAGPDQSSAFDLEDLLAAESRAATTPPARRDGRPGLGSNGDDGGCDDGSDGGYAAFLAVLGADDGNRDDDVTDDGATDAVTSDGASEPRGGRRRSSLRRSGSSAASKTTRPPRRISWDRRVSLGSLLSSAPSSGVTTPTEDASSTTATVTSERRSSAPPSAGGTPEDEDRRLRFRSLRSSALTDSSRGLSSFHHLTGFLEERGLRRSRVAGDGEGEFFPLLARDESQRTLNSGPDGEDGGDGDRDERDNNKPKNIPSGEGTLLTDEAAKDFALQLRFWGKSFLDEEAFHWLLDDVGYARPRTGLFDALLDDAARASPSFDPDSRAVTVRDLKCLYRSEPYVVPAQAAFASGEALMAYVEELFVNADATGDGYLDEGEVRAFWSALFDGREPTDGELREVSESAFVFVVFFHRGRFVVARGARRGSAPFPTTGRGPSGARTSAPDATEGEDGTRAVLPRTAGPGPRRGPGSAPRARRAGAGMLRGRGIVGCTGTAAVVECDVSVSLSRATPGPRRSQTAPRQ